MHVKLGNLGSSLSMSNTLIMHKLFIYARLRAMDWRTQKAQFRNHSSLLPRRQADLGGGPAHRRRSMVAWESDEVRFWLGQRVLLYYRPRRPWRPSCKCRGRQAERQGLQNLIGGSIPPRGSNFRDQ